ncbi:JmjC domain-containing protein [Rubrivivax rivuli]|uniref:Cupin domain-containing protein n=1 Tax=Rubrivivax rivuli TaxID=1862385 RepID=A0A437RCY4_9BURK|nr:cupin domain-containing protein [Rubrivivax rivuli]RVU44604.1 cupin domain-containing protein [Rubrivivax rivuli]
MDVNLKTPLLGGLSPATFMRRHWQKKPLLVRQALAGVQPPLPRPALFSLAEQEGVESRLVQRTGPGATDWRVRQGPLPRRALPPVARPGWTLLVQGLDLHVPAARALLERFRFVPDVRLDDLMVSWASPGGGVGAHVDSYDVFLLQVQGRREWRIAPPAGRGEPAWVEGAPLKQLRDFSPTETWVLEPGDMLYLPPGWGHDGTAVGGDCMTCSIGFRSPSAGELARELLLRLSDDEGAPGLYRDPRQAATAQPGELPPALLQFAQRALLRHLADPQALPRALGEILTEPKPQVWFEGRDAAGRGSVVLDARTRMAYDARHVFINGESFVAGGRDARLMRQFADTRTLSARDRALLSEGAAELLGDWLGAGWAHEQAA